MKSKTSLGKMYALLQVRNNGEPDFLLTFSHDPKQLKEKMHQLEFDRQLTTDSRAKFRYAICEIKEI